MSYEVKIIEDSIYEGSRLTTFQLRYPRFIHAEFMTHRVFSRNASSSRAIPVETMIQQVLDDPAMPVHWGKNQAGMQARYELEGEDLEYVQTSWRMARDWAVHFAKNMKKKSAHKQVVNRILEPFQWISVVCTSSDYSNFFDLRCHEDAQPEIKLLADMMKEAYDKNTPEELTLTEYHLPYVKQVERERYSKEDCVKFSVARCARVSYLTHDGENPTPEKDIALYDRLVGSRPLHASPAEHQARPYPSFFSTKIKGGKKFELAPKHLNGNFTPQWIQYRKCLELDKPELFFYGREY